MRLDALWKFLGVASAVAVLLGACSGLPTNDITAVRQAAPSLQEEQPPFPSVHVTGTGTASAEPDIARVTLGVEIVGADADAALEEANRRMGAVLDALDGAGVAEDDVQTITFDFSIEEIREDRGQPTGEFRYRVVNLVQATVRDLDNLGEILQASLDSGANVVQGVAFSIEDPSALRSEARQQALTDAEAKATELAEGLDARLGPVRQIREGAIGPVRPEAAMEARAVGGEVPLARGTLIVTLTVDVIFDLRTR